MRVKANAKINLGLDVVKRKEDGYHELDMIMIPITLCDIIDIEISENDKLTCDDSNLVINESNTILKAVNLMRKQYGFHECFSIHLSKHIPMEAGLAGGSADAAAVMKAINSLLSLHIPLQELSLLSKQIGADVPFCVLNTCASVKGIGEIIKPFPMNCDFHILLVKPHCGVSTKIAFQKLHEQPYLHPDCDRIMEACVENDFEKLCRNLGNSLEASAFQMVDELVVLKDELKQLGFDGVLMSGSGSTIFALTQKKAIITKAKEILNTKYPFVLETMVYK